MNKRLRILASCLALVAVVGLVGAEMHVHANPTDHSSCRLCLSSVASVAVLALAIAFFISWSCVGFSPAFVPTAHAQAVVLVPCSRAPPRVPSA